MMADSQKLSGAKGVATWANVVLCVFILLAIGYGVKRVHDAEDIVALFNPGVAVSHRVTSLGDHLRLEDYRFEINQVTKMITASFSVTNLSAGEIRDIHVSCDYKDRAGNYHGSGKWVIYDRLEPGHQARFQVTDKRYISHRTTPDSIVCRIVDTGPQGGAGAPHDTTNNH